MSIPNYIQLREAIPNGPIYGVGLMSGTSIDAIDATVVELNSALTPPIKLIHFIEYDIPSDLRNRLLQSLNPERSSTPLLCQLNVEVGQRFAEAAIEVVRTSGMGMDRIEFIGSHGQTVYHIPAPQPARDWRTRSTLQIGDPCVIAAATGVTTVGDFRIGDMAVGGVGAPLIPFVDAFLFAHSHEDIVFQNLGGIGNCTLIDRERKITAFDTGPANLVMDAIIQRLKPECRFDDGGKLAQSGHVIPRVLNAALEHPYFDQPPPKSTGHEDFGNAFVERLIDAVPRATLEDLLATACEITVRSIELAYTKYIFPRARPTKVIVSGGGTKNCYLMDRLEQAIKSVEWIVSSEYGIPSDAKEAMGFAVLAYAALKGIPANIPSVTGASREVILGKIAPATPPCQCL